MPGRRLNWTGSRKTHAGSTDKGDCVLAPGRVITSWLAGLGSGFTVGTLPPDGRTHCSWTTSNPATQEAMMGE